MATTRDITVAPEIANTGDDGTEFWLDSSGPPGTFQASNCTCGVNGGVIVQWVGMRWRMFIPKRAEVLSAQVVGNIDVIDGTPLSKIHGANVDNAPPFGTVLPSQAPLTSAFLQHDPTATGPMILDVTSIVQEIHARALWLSGNYMSLIYVSESPTGGASHQYKMRDYSDGAPTRLVVQYRVPLVTVARIAAQDLEWSASVRTPRLRDLSRYRFEVVAVDAAGNESNTVESGDGVAGEDGFVEYVVRKPDAPSFVATYDSGTGQVTFNAG